MSDQTGQAPAEGRNDWDLVELARDGDRDAFGELYRRHGTTAYNLALRMVGNPWDAADISQEAFIKAFRSLSSFAGSARFGTWLHRIVVNASYDHLRRKRADATEQEVLDRAQAEHAEDAAGPGGPGGAIAAATGTDPAVDGLSDAVREALLDLDESFRSVVVLCDLLGFSYGEAAEILEVKEGTVKSRLFRARSSLAERLRPAGYGASDEPQADPPAQTASSDGSADHAANPRDGPLGRGNPGASETV